MLIHILFEYLLDKSLYLLSMVNRIQLFVNDRRETIRSSSFCRILLWYTKITSKLQIVQDLQMGLSTVSQNLNAIWQDYLKHLAFAMRNLNMIIDSPIIISGYLAPYLVPEDLNMLLHLINENNPFTLTADQLLVGTHGQYTPAIGAALHYINRFVHEGTAL